MATEDTQETQETNPATERADKINEKFRDYLNDLDFTEGLGEREYDEELGLYVPVKKEAKSESESDESDESGESEPEKSE